LTATKAAGGRIGKIIYGTKIWNSVNSTYTDSPSRLYEASYNAKGLKTSVKTSTWSGSAFVEDTSKAQSYAYETERDYLTSATYNSGTDTWSYDNAGNRSNSGYSYDVLNRMTASPSVYTYEHDVLGNRTWRNHNDPVGSRTVKHTWDEVNRMKSLQASSGGASYTYRADGMRVRKIEGIYLGVNVNEAEEVSGYYDIYSGICTTWKWVLFGIHHPVYPFIV